MNRLALVAILLIGLAGCRAVGRWLAPIQLADLTAKMQTQLAQRDEELKTAKADMAEEIKKAKDELKKARESIGRGVSGNWIFYSALGLAILALGVSIFWALRIDGQTGGAGAAASIGVVALSVTWLRYGHWLALGGALMLLAVMACGTAYLAVVFYRRFVSIVKSVETAKPDMDDETIETLGKSQDALGIREAVRDVRTKLGMRK